MSNDRFSSGLGISFGVSRCFMFYARDGSRTTAPTQEMKSTRRRDNSDSILYMFSNQFINFSTGRFSKASAIVIKRNRSIAVGIKF